MNPMVLALLTTITIPATHACADFVEFSDRAEWVAAIGGFEQMQTISFYGYPSGTPLYDQYADLGALFPDGNDYIASSSAYLLDGAGAISLFGPITLEFEAPRTSIGIHFPGFLILKLYSQGALIYTSNEFGVGGAGFFGGVISSEPFDLVEIFDPSGDVSIDTVHFGLPVPGPGGLGLLAIAGFLFRHPHRR
ncbi:MAG: hypothetical protein L0Y44_04835 [Phycisphaerales bacterium]|nr:hypothetical protein [Phycisphaerales bacterium]MCI0629962.1 hypothetical protein [Phycisphaerales bacterium]MCI0675327.1 hypothetical protein [Phycisphaerales bacterium]